MANYRMDELELNWISDQKYYFKATVNADKTDTNQVSGTISGNELVFYPGVIKGDKKIIFTCNEVDFANYKPDQFLLFSIFDNYSIPAEKKKKGGIVIADTIYPPPNTFMPYYFPNRFTIKKLLITRMPGTHKFSVTITSDHDPLLGEYKLYNYEFRPDERNYDYPVLIFNINEITPAPASLPVFSAATDIEFEEFPHVLPFFFVRTDDYWKDVDMKKGTFYIE